MAMSVEYENEGSSSSSWPLSLEEYERYGRQMIQPDIGLQGQLNLKNAKVAVVGAGGLGCPTLQYLAGAGVGTIGIFDHDTVGLSNLHRQILHTTDRVGSNKAESARLALQGLNPLVNLVAHQEAITPSTALDQLRHYTLLVDCTDRPLTRYLLNDVAVRLNIPLVSGAAISSAGQWAIYGGSYQSGPNKGKKRACYRCIWPSVLPNSGGNGNCEEYGVWNVVTGMVGTGMAGEVIKLLVGKISEQPLLHLFHLHSNPLIRTIRLKPPSPKCIACGPDATITDDLDVFGYEAFCSSGGEVDDETGLNPGVVGERISALDLSDLLVDPNGVSVIDTRPEIEFGICALPDSINIPLPVILSKPENVPTSPQMIFICRRGNDSQVAAAAVRKALIASEERLEITDVRGGLRAWSKEVDHKFPIY